MRKGDEKRQQLLDAAEQLFCQKGYEGTGVQDILGAASLSKGGFYHHFTSKEEVLRALCERRAARLAAQVTEALHAAVTPMGRINAVLHGFMPLRREEAAFVRMLLPVIGKAEGRAVAMAYQDALLESFLPLLKSEVAAAAAVEVVCPPVKDIETVILHTVNHCWMEMAAQLAEGKRPEAPELLSRLDAYRRVVEVLLDAPYGSIEIIRVEEWAEVLQRIHS